jgi:hypothetical protein
LQGSCELGKEPLRFIKSPVAAQELLGSNEVEVEEAEVEFEV